MEKRRIAGAMLALAVLTGSLGLSAAAAGSRDDGEPVSAIERASGYFNTDISAGKIMKIGGAVSLRVGESVNFDANYSPRDASVDFGVLDANNVFVYITASKGTVNGGVTVTESGSYTPAIRNSSASTINVFGTIDC